MRPQGPFSPLASWRLLVGEPDVRTRYSERGCCQAPMTGNEVASTELGVTDLLDGSKVALRLDGNPRVSLSQWTLPVGEPLHCIDAEYVDDADRALGSVRLYDESSVSCYLGRNGSDSINM